MRNTEVMSLICPDCGGRMQMEENGKKAVCPYCGHSVLLQIKDVEQAAYEYHKGKARAEKETEKQKKRAILRKKLMVTGIILLSVIGILLLSPEGRRLVFPRHLDPFQFARISFSGESGNGCIEIKNEAAGDLAGLCFYPDRDRGLQNGDTVRITAEYILGYRWDPAWMDVTVEGLTEAVQTPSQLTEKFLENVETLSRQMIDSSWEEVRAVNPGIAWETEPLRQIFVKADDGNQQRDNYLFDIWRTEVIRDNGEVIVFFQAVSYGDVMQKGDGSIVADFSSARLENWNLGYFYGFGASSTVYGWDTEEALTAELTSLRGYSAVS